ncbi:antibiotic biosynthesis monooxygenase family protein [Corynebacterium lactis]|uniref:Monooxygenase n=1 Tax=Corynebacterium lactis RW2-5 TaxID=1408189 RepID=A0A0K2GYA2_9CORY|nr:antibiotic biosynthesis monooxygenase [Corynebacterium lactis]ALA66762.1 monooxygenase [Corynebacterium lactis RW2-5]
MSIVKINAITVPEGSGEELERRFAGNASKISQVPGFVGFQLLRPTAGESRYFVFTEWESEEAYDAWRNGHAFKKSHEGERKAPVSTGAELLEFDVVLDVKAQA